MPILIASLVVGFLLGIVFTLGWISIRKQQGKLIFEWNVLPPSEGTLSDSNRSGVNPPHHATHDDQEEKPLYQKQRPGKKGKVHHHKRF